MSATAVESALIMAGLIMVALLFLGWGVLQFAYIKSIKALHELDRELYEQCCPNCGRKNTKLIELDDEDPSCGYRATVVKCEGCVCE